MLYENVVSTFAATLIINIGKLTQKKFHIEKNILQHSTMQYLNNFLSTFCAIQECIAKM